MISRLVGQRHCLDSDIAVCRHVVSKLKNGYPTIAKLTRTERRAFFDRMLAVHRQNRAVYHAVLRGEL